MATPVALLLILPATAIESLLLVLGFAGEVGSLPFLALTTTVSVPAILGLAVLGHSLLRRGNGRVESLSTRLETALQARQTAEAANLAKARYLANVSHEIRSPLNAIYGYAQLIEQEVEVRPKHAARVIRRCVEHITSVVESLLDLSRMENGLLRVRSEVVHLPDFLEQIVLMMRPAAKAKQLDFVYEPSAGLPRYVRTDQSRLRQALINLIGNAIKFTEEGSVTFKVHYRGQTASFEIRDTGPGIAPEDHARIFDPYERVAESGAPMQPGIGLGLPITQAIVQILGGNLELESEPGQGACFRITLMLGEPVGALAPDTPDRRIIGYEGPTRSILLVEDSADQRGFFEQFLVGCGFDVVAMPDGETAVALGEARSFDLAVLDISLPGMSGWETAARLRELMGPDVLIVMASANANEFHRPEYDRPMHDHFLVKPFKLEEMADVIGGLLKLSWKWQATEGVGGKAGPTGESAMGGERTRLPAAALPHIEHLHDRIKIGHVRGIEAEIRLLAEAAPEQGEMIDALHAALDRFDLATMSKVLERAC